MSYKQENMKREEAPQRHFYGPPAGTKTSPKSMCGDVIFVIYFEF